jgi:hypothetical protein
MPTRKPKNKKTKASRKAPAKGGLPKSLNKSEDSDARLKVLEAYIGLIKKSGMLPTRSEMIMSGVSRDRIRQHFGTLEGLKNAAKDKEPSLFDNLIIEENFTEDAHEHLLQEIKKYKRFVITTAVTGCIVHEGFLSNIRAYCKRKNAKLLVMPASDPGSTQGFTLDASLGIDSIVFSDLQLNSNLFLCSIKMSAKHIDPSTGLDRIGQRHGSFIYASPKQRLKFMPVSNVKLPHAEMTTGAITLPNYTPKKYMSERTAYIATHDHVMGALIVEVVDDNRYHFRQIQADSDGSFVDLGDFYQQGKVSKLYAEGFVLGDWHSGETDPTARRAWREVCELVRPKKLFIHDGFNGLSINHHERHRQIRRSKLSSQGLLNLENELRTYAADLDDLASWPHVQEILAVKSNHDVFLDNWLEEGGWTDDPENYRLALKLADAMAEGKNPLKFACERLNMKNISKVRWLKMDEDYFIAGIQCGAHGHKGPKGSRGNIKGMESAYGRSNTGHAHGPEILRGAWQCGTSSYLKLDYNQGPSDWVHASILTYPNGMRQLINSFDGEWRLKEENATVKNKKK